MKFDIIMFTMSGFYDFESGLIHNRNFSVWKTLRKRPDVNKIIAVDFSPFNPKTALKNFIRSGMYKHRPFTCSLRNIDEKTWVFSSIDPFLNKQKFLEQIRSVLHHVDFGNDAKKIVWSYDPLTLAGWESVDADIRIFDTVDNWMTHGNFTSYVDRLKANYASVNEKADLVFTVAPSLKDMYAKKEKVHWVPNGVDLTLFDFDKVHDVPADLMSLPRPIIGYAGVIQDRVDFDLLEYIASKNPSFSFVLVGSLWPVFLRKFRPKAPEIKRLEKYKNIHFLGVRPYHHISSYIKSFDVALIPHKINALTQSMNPLKLYEYLAMGCPIVTTPVAGLEKFSEFLFVADTKEAFEHSLHRALARNSLADKQARVHAVRDESWERRVDQMMKLVSAHVSGVQ